MSLLHDLVLAEATLMQRKDVGLLQALLSDKLTLALQEATLLVPLLCCSLGCLWTKVT